MMSYTFLCTENQWSAIFENDLRTTICSDRFEVVSSDTKKKIIPEHNHNNQQFMQFSLMQLLTKIHTYCITRQVCFLVAVCWSWTTLILGWTPPTGMFSHTYSLYHDILRVSQTQSNLNSTAYLPDGSISNIILWLVLTFLCSIANICPGFLMSQTSNSLSCMRHK